MVSIPLFTGFYTSQVVVWDFFHQQYGPFPSKHSPVESLVIFPLSPFFHQLAAQLGFIVSHLVGPVTKGGYFYHKRKKALEMDDFSAGIIGKW